MSTTRKPRVGFTLKSSDLEASGLGAVAAATNKSHESYQPMDTVNRVVFKTPLILETPTGSPFWMFFATANAMIVMLGYWDIGIPFGKQT